MRFINKLSSAPNQRSILTGNPGQRITLSVRYLPTQQTWLMDIEAEGFVLRGAAIVNGVNLLRNYRNLIPFGLVCATDDGVDPAGVEDFESGYARLYLLDRAEVEQVEAVLYS